MSRMEPTRTMIALTVLCGLVWAVQRQALGQTTPAAARSVAPSASRGLAAIEAAAREGKYLFIFFWKTNDAQSRNMYGVFQAAMNKWAASANAVGIQITDPNERPLVEKYGVSRAPMPLVLALAPNGAVTKAFPLQFTEEQLRSAFVSPCTARCLKALQERKLVLVCIQNQQTQYSQAAWQGAQQFKTDARFAAATEVVTVDPADSREASLLQALQVDPRTPTAVTVLLAPPGRPVARFAGVVTKQQLVARVAAAQSSCCPGGACGPGGCGSKR